MDEKLFDEQLKNLMQRKANQPSAAPQAKHVTHLYPDLMLASIPMRQPVDRTPVITKRRPESKVRRAKRLMERVKLQILDGKFTKEGLTWSLEAYGLMTGDSSYFELAVIAGKVTEVISENVPEIEFY